MRLGNSLHSKGVITKPPLLQTIMPPFDQLGESTLRYPDLKSIVGEYYRDEYRSLRRYDVLDLLKADDTVLQKYIPAIALKIQEAGTRDEQLLWTRRFTKLSIRLFGQPDFQEAAKLAAAELLVLEKICKQHTITTQAAPVLDAYRAFLSQSGAAQNSNTQSDNHTLLARLRNHLEDRYSSIYAVFDERPMDAILDANEVRAYFTQMIGRLCTFDAAWGQWKVVANETTQMAVAPQRQELYVGAYLPPLSVRRAKSLFTHEVLVHAQRSVRGAAYGYRLAYGLPGYVSAEEGLGVLMEGAIEGQMPYRVGDRYIDIAMALGVSGQAPMTRQQLFDIVYARTLLRRLNEGAPVDEDLARLASWQHVNRIYRGTLGNDIVGVFTKDIVYYRGYKEMARYLSQYEERDLRHAVDFVLSGKMNPTDLAHRFYIHDRKFSIVRSKGDERSLF